MPLQTSGPISIGDIRGEFGGPTPASISSYYAGGPYVNAGTGSIPSSGAISLGQFYGAGAVAAVINSLGVYPALNQYRVLNEAGTLTNSKTGTAAQFVANVHVRVGNHVVCYGSDELSGPVYYEYYVDTNEAYRMTSSLAKVGSTIWLGAYTRGTSACPVRFADLGMIWGGLFQVSYNYLTRMNETLGLVGPEITVGTGKAWAVGMVATPNSSALFYGGNHLNYSSSNHGQTSYNVITKAGALVSNNVNLAGTTKRAAGAIVDFQADNIGIVYGGWSGSNRTNTAFGVRGDGTISTAQYTLSVAKVYFSGVCIGSTGIYYGGSTSNTAQTANIVRINSAGTRISNEVAVGSSFSTSARASGI